jgi:hypothetical protein
MRISWVITETAHLDPTIDISVLKNVGPFWGSWKTWRSWTTDNVVCHDAYQARDLVSKNFHQRCNLYLPSSAYQSLDRPTGVRLYEGEFHQLIDYSDDVVSMHLASGNSDIVLMFGFDLGDKNLEHDKLAKHKWVSYQKYVQQIITDASAVQWVMLDYKPEISKELKKVPNLQFDTLQNVLAQLK